MSHLRVFIVFLSIALWLSSCTTTRGQLIIADDTETLREPVLRTAAEPLLARGVRVHLSMAAQGDASGVDHQQRLARAGLLDGINVQPDVIAIYVSLQPRFSELRVGSRWNERLNNAALDVIRQGTLGPALRSGDYTAAMASTLVALDQQLILPVWQRAMVWIGFGIMAAALLYVLLARVRLRRSHQQYPHVTSITSLMQELEGLHNDVHNNLALAGQRKTTQAERQQIVDELAPLKQRRKLLRQNYPKPGEAQRNELQALISAYRILASRSQRLRPARARSTAAYVAPQYATSDSSDSSSSYSSSSANDSSSSSYDSGSSSGSESSSSGSW